MRKNSHHTVKTRITMSKVRTQLFKEHPELREKLSRIKKEHWRNGVYAKAHDPAPPDPAVSADVKGESICQGTQVTRESSE